MIERLKESHGAAFGFKVDRKNHRRRSQGIRAANRICHRRNGKNGQSASSPTSRRWRARTGKRAGMRCVFCRNIPTTSRAWRWSAPTNGKKIVAIVLAGTAVLQAETRYFTSAEITFAWEWVRTSKNADRVPVRTMYEGTGLVQGLRARIHGPLMAFCIVIPKRGCIAQGISLSLPAAAQFGCAPGSFATGSFVRMTPRVADSHTNFLLAA